MPNRLRWLAWSSPFLFAAYPILFLYAHNIADLSLRSLALPLAVALGLTAALFLTLGFVISNDQKAGLITTLFAILFFSCGHAYEGLISSPFGRSWLWLFINIKTALLAVWSVIFIAGTVAILRTKRDLGTIKRLLVITGAVLVGTTLASIGSYEIFRDRSLPVNNQGGSKEEAAESGSVKTPNIYYIVVDAYAGKDALKRFYGFDNSEFLDYLERKGFYVANRSRSNYPRTSLSLASSLNMAYLKDLMPAVDTDSRDIGASRRLIRHNEVFRSLRRRGYTIVAVSSGCADTELDNADVYFKPGWTLDEFQNAVIGTTPIPLFLDVTGSPDQFDAHRNRILFEFDQISRLSSVKAPFFAFAHIEIPHPPFVFGADGQRLNPGTVFHDRDGNWLIRDGRLTRSEYVRQYVDQLTYTNHKLKMLIDSILSGAGTPPILILQSDHGPRSMLSWEDPEKTDFRECMSIVNAYYLPGGAEALYEDISPVNTFRIIFNRYFGTDYTMLEDRNYFSTARYPYRFIDVTGSMTERHRTTSSGR